MFGISSSAARRLGLLLAAGLAFAAFPAGGRASAPNRTPIRSCKPSKPKFALAVRAQGVGCLTAGRVERYAVNHDWSRFRLHGRTWRGTVYSHALKHTYVRFRSGEKTVYIIVRYATPPGNGLGIGSSSGDSGCGYTGEIAYFPMRVNPGNKWTRPSTRTCTASSAPASAATAPISRFGTSRPPRACTR